MGDLRVADLTYLITGGVGSLGRRLTRELLRPEYPTKVVRVLDNNENGIARLNTSINDIRLRCFVGDIRDKNRLMRAMENVDVCIHAAALKHVNLCETNPFESLETNVYGTQNCIDAALAANIDKFLFCSSDKAVEPVSTYGRCKALAESLTLDAHHYKGDRKTKCSVVRPPNYYGSDESVHYLWKRQLKAKQPLSVTHPDMTRYFMSFPEIIAFIMKCLGMMKGGEIFVPTEAKKMRILDMAKKISGNIQIIGVRKGEKLEEKLFAPYEEPYAHVEDGIMVIRYE